MIPVLVLGDSIVNQIQEYGKSPLSHYDVNFSLDKHQFKVHYIGVSGGKIAKFRNLNHVVPNWSLMNPKVVILHIGTNDVRDVTEDEDPLKVAFLLVEWVRRLLAQLSVSKVIVSSIIPRTKQHRRMKMTLEQFNKAVGAINKFLQEIYRNNKVVQFWHHKRLETPFIERYINAKDGVHLTQKGHEKWVRGIRGALLPCGKF